MMNLISDRETGIPIALCDLDSIPNAIRDLGEMGHTDVVWSKYVGTYYLPSLVDLDERKRQQRCPARLKTRQTKSI